MNVYDSVRMADVMAPMGYTTTDMPDDADLVVLNTCHIREKAEEKVYSDLGRIRARKNANEDMLIAVGGCVAQAEGEEILRRAPYVDIVVGSQSYHHLPDMVARVLREKNGQVELDFPEVQKFDFLPESTSPQGVAAFLAVQEGCDKFCTFCVVPYTRGAEYSRPAADIVAEARQLVDGGAVEIMLLGQNVNAYHGDDSAGGSATLASLIDQLAQINGLERIRYTTSHPRDMSDDLIAIHGSEPKLMPYLHLPIQAGSDAVLKKMNRKHTAAEYIDIIHRLRDVRPDIALSSDFIVGFPGETDADFDDTVKLVQAVGYASSYSFKYSPRPGTPAATAEQVPEAVKEQRLAQLQAVLRTQHTEFNMSCVGKTMDVLLHRKGKYDGQLAGRSPWLQSVYVQAPEHLNNSMVTVKITGATGSSLQGELISNNMKDAA